MPRPSPASTTPGCPGRSGSLTTRSCAVLPGLRPPPGPANTGGPGCRPPGALCGPVLVLPCRFLVSGVCEPLCSFLSQLSSRSPALRSPSPRGHLVIPKGHPKSPLHPGSAVSPAEQELSTSLSPLLRGAPRKPGATIWVTRNTKHLNTFYEIPQRAKTKMVKKKKKN